MEYCGGGSLQDLINERRAGGVPVSEKYVWKVLSQLASALVYCHFGLRIEKNGHVSSERKSILDWSPILHRDIKPANIFLANRSEDVYDSIKLGDFGLGYVLQDDSTPETYAGTAQYLAPEINRMTDQPIH